MNANTLTDERKKTGRPYKGTGRTVVSNGGKTMTTTVKGTNADGKEFTQTFVFDKQSGTKRGARSARMTPRTCLSTISSGT